MQDENYKDELKKAKVASFLEEYNNNAHAGIDKTAEIWKFIRQEKIREYEVARMAEDYGLTLLYLPPYWPELNAIEKMWARLKAAYRKTSPHMAWQDRLAEAYAVLDTDFITRIISSTIKWAREKHEELKTPGPVVANVVLGGLEPDETLEGHGDSGDDEDVDPLELAGVDPEDLESPFDDEEDDDE